MDGEIHMIENTESRRRGMIGTIVIHALILALLLLPLITFPIPPPGQQGILVSLGVPEQGQGNDKPATQNKEVVKPQPVAAEQPQEAPSKQVEKKVEPAKKDVITAESPQIVAVDESEKERERERLEAEAEMKRQQEAEEARKRAEAEAIAKKQAEADANKKQFSNILSGSGKGSTDTPGNQGDPNGDPNAAVLEGISSGSGMVGGGLGDRGVLYEPRIQDNSQKTGKVVVNVCVDQAGDVVSATYTQRGSTTTDSELKDLAIRSAKKFRFTDSEIEKQCGTITIDFKLQ